MHDLTHESILIVEDDADHREMLERCFADFGCPVTVATGGREALELLGKDSFSLVISDIQMPEVDGVAVLRFVKEHVPETDVILITGFSEKYSFTDVIQHGATDYLEKPFSRDAILAKASRIFRERFERDCRLEAERVLQKKTDELGERVKELNCLYQISRVIDLHENDLDKIVAGILREIPPALQYPNIASARIVIDDREFYSAHFKQSRWCLKQTFKAGGREAGFIEICYNEARKEAFDGPFLKEEKDLLSGIADKIGRTLLRIHTTKALNKTTGALQKAHAELETKVHQRTQDLYEAQAALLAVFRSVPDGILSVDREMGVLSKNDKCMTELQAEPGQVFTQGATKFQQECHRILLTTILNNEPVRDYRLEFDRHTQNHRVYLVSSSNLTSQDGTIMGALLIIHDQTQVAKLENQLVERRQHRRIIGESPAILKIYERIRQLSSVDTTVLISGESGVGKEMLVDTLHEHSDRAQKPLVKVNCLALPENLLESELFGHVKGAFTGATKDRVGRIGLAEGGILFLDEIGDISFRLQLKLLRFLEHKEYERVGESQKRLADVRVFAATNADLKKKVASGEFREDLYYRLKVMVIHVPPLRERIDDIPLLVEHFRALLNTKFHKEVGELSREVMNMLTTYYWPGNVRELRHALEHAFLLCQGHDLRIEHFPHEMTAPRPPHFFEQQPARSLTRELLVQTLEQTHWHRTKTAKLLKISRATLYNKLKEFGISQKSL